MEFVAFGEIEFPVLFFVFFGYFSSVHLSHLVMTSLTSWRHVTLANERTFLWERNPICFKETVTQPTANDDDFIKEKKTKDLK